jgi:hypothetical protein
MGGINVHETAGSGLDLTGDQCCRPGDDVGQPVVKGEVVPLERGTRQAGVGGKGLLRVRAVRSLRAE